MKVAIRDDDTSYFTKPKDLQRAYDFLNEDDCVSLSVVPYTVPVHRDDVFPYGKEIGMGYYDIKEKRYFKIRSQLFNDITALRYEPSSERIWICAQNQLFSYCIKENRFIQWNRSDGFYPNEIIFTYQQRAEKNSR